MFTTQQQLPVGTILVCIQAHPDGRYTVNDTYKVNAYQVVENYTGVRIRDDRRERKDFNFIPSSKNYVWKYFKVLGEE